MQLFDAQKAGLQLVDNAIISINIKTRIFIADLQHRKKIDKFRRDYPQIDYPVSAQEWRDIDICTNAFDPTKRCLFIGAIGGPVPHHGHSLLETISRWWPLWNQEFMQNIDVLVLTWLDIYSAYVAKTNQFIPNIAEYVNSLPNKGSNAKDLSIDWATKILLASGQGSKPLIIVAESTKFNNLWIPIQSAAMGPIDPAGPEYPLATDLYQNLARFWSQDSNHSREAVDRMQSILNSSTRLWLSRRCILDSRTKENNIDKPSSDQQRCCTNEPELETLLQEKFGFTAVRMEEFTLQEQIYLMAHSSLLGGLYGSAMHNCMFAPPNIQVIVLGDQRWPSYMQPAQQNAINIAKANGHFFPLVSKSKNPITWCYEWDLDYLIHEISKILNQSPEIRVYYGVPGKWSDVTKEAYLNCYDMATNQLFIPSGEVERGTFFGDPLHMVLKSIRIVHHSLVDIYNHDKEIFIENPIFQPDVMACGHPTGRSKAIPRLQNIHRSLNLKYGSLKEEYPEQLMSVLFIKPSSLVLEIGGNIGRNSCTIASILGEANSQNLVVLESDPKSVVKLQVNRDLNRFKFHIEPSALSARRLCQNSWNTLPIVGEHVPTGWVEISTIDWTRLQQKYGLKFDTLVADCEGALYYILQDFPSILDNITTICIENDFQDQSQKESVLATFASQGFNLVYQASYSKSTDFYQAWIKE